MNNFNPDNKLKVIFENIDNKQHKKEMNPSTFEMNVC